MVKHKYIDWICIGAAVLAAMLTILLMFGEQLGIPKASATPGYATRLFDDSRVHTIDIQIADWGAFIADAEGEEYVACTVEIDGEASVSYTHLMGFYTYRFLVSTPFFSK